MAREECSEFGLSVKPFFICLFVWIRIRTTDPQCYERGTYGSGYTTLDVCISVAEPEPVEPKLFRDLEPEPKLILINIF